MFPWPAISIMPRVKTSAVLGILVLQYVRDCYAPSKLHTTAVISVAEESAIV
jgi:hypothetical protein